MKTKVSELEELVVERYAYHAGLLRAKSTHKEARKAAGEGSLKTLKKNLRKMRSVLEGTGETLKLGALHSQIKMIKNLDVEVKALSKEISEETEPTAQRVNAFNRAVELYDGLVVDILKERKLYKEYDEIPTPTEPVAPTPPEPTVTATTEVAVHA